MRPEHLSLRAEISVQAIPPKRLESRSWTRFSHIGWRQAEQCWVSGSVGSGRLIGNYRSSASFELFTIGVRPRKRLRRYTDPFHSMHVAPSTWSLELAESSDKREMDQAKLLMSSHRSTPAFRLRMFNRWECVGKERLAGKDSPLSCPWPWLSLVSCWLAVACMVFSPSIWRTDASSSESAWLSGRIQDPW